MIALNSDLDAVTKSLIGTITIVGISMVVMFQKILDGINANGFKKS